MIYVLYNPFSGEAEKTKALADTFAQNYSAPATLIDMASIESYSDFFSNMGEEDKVIIFGGDGTVNRIVNATDPDALKCEVLYYPAGTGNDFAQDIGKLHTEEPFAINEYMKNLPTVTVNGKDYKFINGVGYGIDGYCCEVGDKMKSEGKKPNYTSIAISGLLFHFKPRNATVIVDGVESEYKKVWIAPTMFGSHYGGGMIPTPEQKRDGEGKVSLMLFHGSNKLKTLMIFPSIFKGQHVKHTECVTVLEGKDITVKFDTPTPLQIDGETILDVLEYRVRV